MATSNTIKQSRLDELSDGIFAIVMTLLVLEIRVPQLSGIPENVDLMVALFQVIPHFLSYLLSFALLFTYWRAHHYIVSVYAKNIDSKLTNINALFFLLIGLVPFSSQLLGQYSETQAAVVIFGVHMILISLCVLWMRSYVIHSPEIKNPRVTKKELRNGTLRTLLPLFSALVAILVSFYSVKISLAFYTFAIIFNLSHTSTQIVQEVIDRTLGVSDEEK
ncbi:MAG: potassium channel family protein [Patescibacteria group bacterium]|nr:potassium channel family protein [Patescibacteria group bacterium]